MKKEAPLNQEDIERCRDRALLRALKTPPKPHKEMVGKSGEKKPIGKEKRAKDS